MGKALNRHCSGNFDIFVTKITDLNANTSICRKVRVTFRIIKFGRCVDDSSNYVTFHKPNMRIKIKKILTPYNESLGSLCSSGILSSNFFTFSASTFLKSQ